MGGFSLWHWLIVGIIVLLLFGKGRFSDMMGDMAKGLKSFKKGMSEDDDAPPAAPPPARLEDSRAAPVQPVTPTVDVAAEPPRTVEAPDPAVGTAAAQDERRQP